jgi:uncharacterized protein (DUF362 family)
MRLSRRAFLRMALLGGIAAGSAYVFKSTESVGLERWLRWMLRGRVANLTAPRARVALLSCPSYDADITGLLRGVWQTARMPDLKGARVVLKPNLVDYYADHPCYAHPRVVQAVIQLAREAGAAQIKVADGIAFRRDPYAVLDAAGYTDMLARERVEFVDLNYDDLVSIPLRGGYTGLKTLLMSRTVREADLVISIPKLKTHHWTVMSASIKNLFGLAPGIKYGWPKNKLHMLGIPAVLTELVDSLPCRAAAVVDGVIGMEDDGPIMGTPVASGSMVVGADLLSVDATCARLMGMDPTGIRYLDFAAWAGVGTIDESKIDLVGEPLAKLRRSFRRAPEMQ